MVSDNKVPGNWPDALKMADQIAQHVVDGLYTDGAHHKQWHLEEIGKLVGLDLEKLKQEGEWDPGIPG